MYSKAVTAAVLGLETRAVTVEVNVSDGLPLFEMIGMLSGEVREAKERVRNALQNSGVRIPPKRITVNLAPADLKKSGSGFDLAIAAALLVCFGLLPESCLEKRMFFGELGLDGSIQGIRGVLPMVSFCGEMGFQTCYIPRANAREAAFVREVEAVPADSLSHLISLLRGEAKPEPAAQAGDFARKNPDTRECLARDAGDFTRKDPDAKNYLAEDSLTGSLTPEEDSSVDFSDIRGQAFLKRAAEISVAGRHNIFIVGSPGSGKSMTARRIATIFPDLTQEESLEITKIYSIAGLLQGRSMISSRPFRAPHHTITPAGMAGGGKIPVPGEVTLAQKGILFLDEIPEFKRSVIEVLRQPMEDKKITISRVDGSYTFPADFILVAACNPCPCGYYPDMNRCRCSETERKKYLSKLGGPFFDRIDLWVEAPKVTYRDLVTKGSNNLSSKEMKEHVIRARKRQEDRYRDTPFCCNGELSPAAADLYCSLGERERALAEEMFHAWDLSARSYHKLLKVARTIADLEEEDNIRESHLLEAGAYRKMI